MVWNLLLLVSTDKVVKCVKKWLIVTLVTQIYKHCRTVFGAKVSSFLLAFPDNSLCSDGVSGIIIHSLLVLQPVKY